MRVMKPEVIQGVMATEEYLVVFNAFQFILNPHFAKLFIIMIESEVGINGVDIPLKNHAESQSTVVRKPSFFLSTFDSLLPLVWGTKGRIHGKVIANLVTEGTD